MTLIITQENYIFMHYSSISFSISEIYSNIVREAYISVLYQYKNSEDEPRQTCTSFALLKSCYYQVQYQVQK